jgi:hydrogenase/urease accessory protein HupE
MVAFFASYAFGHGMSEAEKQTIIEGGNLRYIWIGATHMLSGYDHLAFVFGIIFFLTHFRDIVKYITAFTIGHSITLIIATFNAIQVNYFLVDAVIALSVCYIAFHNLDGFNKWFNVKAPNMMAMIFSLGLIHGLGLSTRLQQLPLSEDDLLMNIISFNVGIEIGQISALAVMLALIAAFRNSHVFKSFSKAANTFLIVAGAYLFLMQMHGYEHTANAEELTSSSEQKSVGELDVTQEMDWKDIITITIPPRGDKEYKLLLAEGSTLDFSWSTDNEALFFDFHGERTGDKTGAFSTFKKATSSEESGVLVATFNGTHGWYWKNNNSFPVTITMRLKGEYLRTDIGNDSPQVEQGETPIMNEPVHDSL